MSTTPRGWHNYTESMRIEVQGYDFYSLIMAAMRQADTDNLAALQRGFPEIWEQLRICYDTPPPQTTISRERKNAVEQEWRLDRQQTRADTAARANSILDDDVDPNVDEDEDSEDADDLIEDEGVPVEQ